MATLYSDLPQIVKEWIGAHPYQTAFHVINGVVFFTPAVAMTPFFYMLGFTPAGPLAASTASSIMAYFGSISAGGIYATVQSAAMGGYGASVAAGSAQVGAALSSTVCAWLGRN